jgi:predicted SprT family Zn-dependent metalloprotease
MTKTIKSEKETPAALKVLTKSDRSNTYSYQCPCGAEITLYTDTRPDKLIKCFKCQGEVK